jgi:carboxymethylenebutenolidase
MSWTPTIPGTEDAMDLWVERPTQERAPAVIVLQELCGVNSHIRDVARRVAGLGFLAVAPDLFHRSAKRFEGSYDDMAPSLEQAQQMTPAGLVADLRAVEGWLAADAQVDESRVAAWGFCMGGRVALRANIVLPLRGAVSFYGGTSDAVQGDLASSHGPLLLAWGGRDLHIASAMRRSLVGALLEAKKTYVDLEFGDAGHGFFCDERSSYHPASARQAWAITRAFLDDCLGQ